MWLSKNLIVNRLTKSVAAEFDAKLEKLRSQLRESEERLKTELRMKESEIDAIRSGAMTALATRHAAVDKRRLQAVDQIWTSVRTFGSARKLSQILSCLKYDAVSAESEKNPRMRQALSSVEFGFDPKTLDFTSADKARPFVSPMVWANYAALAAICHHAITKWHLLKNGLGSKNLIDDNTIFELLKIALPDKNEYFNSLESSAFHFLVEELEQNLLIEMEKMLVRPISDIANIEQAADILKASNAVLAGLDKSAEKV